MFDLHSFPWKTSTFPYLDRSPRLSMHRRNGNGHPTTIFRQIFHRSVETRILRPPLECKIHSAMENRVTRDVAKRAHILEGHGSSS